MALISSSDRTRLDIPHEPGEWIEARRLRAGDLEGVQVTEQQVSLSIDLLAQLISAWSYDAPVTRESIADLDADTFVWVQGAIAALSGIRPDEEKKESASNSSPAPAAAANGHRRSSRS